MEMLKSMFKGAVLGAIVFALVLYLGLNMLKMPWAEYKSFVSGLVIMSVSGMVFGAVVCAVSRLLNDMKAAGWIAGTILMVVHRAGINTILGGVKLTSVMIVIPAVAGLATAFVILAFVRSK
ncbi:hypothetical protein ACFL1X_08065 [Candidatus Hydrogenedentota bacterium]